MMDLEKIQTMWEKDSKIDPDNLHEESLKIPQLHSKYYNSYNLTSILRENARINYDRLKLERYQFYTGKAPKEEYHKEQFYHKVVGKDSIQRHMDADEKLNKKSYEN